MSARPASVDPEVLAALRDCAEAVKVCVGDAEGQEAFRNFGMLQLTRRQVRFLGEALARLAVAEEQAK